MANEDDSVKSSSFAIFIWVSVSDFIFHIPGETGSPDKPGGLSI